MRGLWWNALRGRRRPISAFCRIFEVNLRAYYQSRAAADTPTFGEKAVYPSYPPDLDIDGWGAACDCDDTNAVTFPGAVEINDGLDNQCPNDPDYGLIDETSGDSGFHTSGDQDEYSWTPQAGATQYEVARASIQAAGVAPQFCSLGTVLDSSYVDGELPATGMGFLYLNRALLPNPGSWGRDSAGQARALGTCGN